MTDTSKLWQALGKDQPANALREFFEATPKNERRALANSVDQHGIPALYLLIVVTGHWQSIARQRQRQKAGLMFANGADPTAAFIYLTTKIQERPNKIRHVLFDLLIDIQNHIETVGMDVAQPIADYYNSNFSAGRPFVLVEPSLRQSRLAEWRTSAQSNNPPVDLRSEIDLHPQKLNLLWQLIEGNAPQLAAFFAVLSTRERRAYANATNEFGAPALFRVVRIPRSDTGEKQIIPKARILLNHGAKAAATFQYMVDRVAREGFSPMQGIFLTFLVALDQHQPPVDQVFFDQVKAYFNKHSPDKKFTSQRDKRYKPAERPQKPKGRVLEA